MTESLFLISSIIGLGILLLPQKISLLGLLPLLAILTLSMIMFIVVLSSYREPMGRFLRSNPFFKARDPIVDIGEQMFHNSRQIKFSLIFILLINAVFVYIACMNILSNVLFQYHKRFIDMFSNQSEILLSAILFVFIVGLSLFLFIWDIRNRKRVLEDDEQERYIKGILKIATLLMRFSGILGVWLFFALLGDFDLPNISTKILANLILIIFSFAVPIGFKQYILYSSIEGGAFGPGQNLFERLEMGSENELKTTSETMIIAIGLIIVSIIVGFVIFSQGQVENLVDLGSILWIPPDNFFDGFQKICSILSTCIFAFEAYGLFRVIKYESEQGGGVNNLKKVIIVSIGTSFLLYLMYLVGLGLTIPVEHIDSGTIFSINIFDSLSGLSEISGGLLRVFFFIGIIFTFFTSMNSAYSATIRLSDGITNLVDTYKTGRSNMKVDENSFFARNRQVISIVGALIIAFFLSLIPILTPLDDISFFPDLNAIVGSFFIFLIFPLFLKAQLYQKEKRYKYGLWAIMTLNLVLFISFIINMIVENPILGTIFGLFFLIFMIGLWFSLKTYNDR